LKKRNIILLVGIAVGLAAVLGALGVGQNPERILAGEVTDAMSGDPVYMARIVIGGRSTIRYVDKEYRITHLRHGIHTLKVTAPGYETKTTEVAIKRGVTSLDIRLDGKEIPNLDHIIVFADSVPGVGIRLDIRFVNQGGVGIKHFPRIPMTIEAKLNIRLGTREKYTKGRLIYSGPVELAWDSEAILGKNKGLIPKSKLHLNSKTDGRYGVLEVILHMNQRDFKDTISEVLLEW